MAAEEDVKAYLDTRSLSATVYCGPVRVAQPPIIPHRAVFVLQSGGYQPTPYMDGTQTAWRTIRLQVRIRGEPNDYKTTRDLAATVWSSMQQPSSLTGSYVRVTCDQSAPFYLGKDDLQCDEYSVNATLEKRF